MGRGEQRGYTTTVLVILDAPKCVDHVHICSVFNRSTQAIMRDNIRLMCSDNIAYYVILLCPETHPTLLISKIQLNT